MKKLPFVWVLLGTLICTTAYARINTIGQASDGLFDPMVFATMLMRFACYVTGASLILGSIMQYRVHLQNPKLTPLFTPILLLFLGIVTIFIPYLTTMFGNSWSAEQQVEYGGGDKIRDPVTPRKPGDKYAPDSEPYWGDDVDNEPSGGHWTDGY